MKLLIMGCSASKRQDAAPMPAIDRYDGPMWRTLRARLAELPAAREAIQFGQLRLMVLSARCGFIAADTEILDYDLRLTAGLAGRLARNPTAQFQMIPGMVDDAEAVLFAGGELYRTTMWRASGGNLRNLMKITETDGAGIGHQRAQLGAWLRDQYDASEMAA